MVIFVFVRPFHHRAVVGEPCLSGNDGLAMGLEHGVENETLRGLGREQAVAGDRVGDRLVVVDALERVRYRVGGKHRLGTVLQRLDDPVDGGAVDEGAGGVVDENEFGALVGDAFEADAGGFLPRLAAMDDTDGHQSAQFAGGRLEKLLVIGMDDDDDARDLRMVEERPHRPRDDRHAADLAVLLGCPGVGATAVTAASRHDHGPDSHAVTH